MNESEQTYVSSDSMLLLVELGFPFGAAAQQGSGGELLTLRFL
jgi:hypothetical protein